MKYTIGDNIFTFVIAGVHIGLYHNDVLVMGLYDRMDSYELVLFWVDNDNIEDISIVGVDDI